LKQTAVLLVNLGSPESPTVPAVKTYLSEFLMDKYVIDIPYLARLFLVRGIIIPNRVKYSTSLYKKAWTDEGSPLTVNSEKLLEKIKENTTVKIALAMRYGSPSIKDELYNLYRNGVTNLLVIPMYPQFAMSTTQTVMQEVNKQIKKLKDSITVTELKPFYNQPDYIKVLSQSIKKQLNNFKFDHLLFSYHGIPERHIKKSDITKSHCQINDTCCSSPSKAHEYCYRHQCFETTKLTAQLLNLNENEYSISFQSRLGKDPWLQPYTSQHIKELALKGVENLAVVTPAFVSDCLETIEEIGMEGKETFLENGGTTFKRIECLNDEDAWATILTKWINNYNENL